MIFANSKLTKKVMVVAKTYVDCISHMHFMDYLTVIMVCLPSKQGVEKSSYKKLVLNPGRPLKWSSVHSHTLP